MRSPTTPKRSVIFSQSMLLIPPAQGGRRALVSAAGDH